MTEAEWVADGPGEGGRQGEADLRPQFHKVTGKMEPYPIKDEADVDQRRKEVGLPPLAEYRKMIEELYKPKAKDKGGE